MSTELHDEVAKLSDKELVTWTALFNKLAALHTEIEELHAMFAALATDLGVTHVSDVHRAIRDELARRTQGKSDSAS
jgi:hypothetical protein